MATVNYYTTGNFHIVFRDSNGQPLVSGHVYFFRAADHATAKAVFQDKAGTIPFTQPLDLNIAGVVADSVTGAPKPIYYADDEDYYVEAYRSGEGPPGDVAVQTVDNWNSNLADFPAPAIDESNLTNYILNPQFRYVIKDSFTNAELVTSTEVPIADEGWFFYRDTANSTNQITFVDFITGQTDVPHNPKQYMEFQCTINGTETRKDILLPLNDAITFSSQTMSAGIWGRSDSGATANVELILRQFFGSGGSLTVETIIDTFTLGATWEAHEIENFVVPSVLGKTIGAGNRIEVGLRMPLNAISKIQIVNIQKNLGDTLYDFSYVSSVEEDNRKKAFQLPDIDTFDADVGSTTYGYPVVADELDWTHRNVTGSLEPWLLGDQPTYSLPMKGDTHTRLATIPGTPVLYNRLYQAWENDSEIGNGNAFGYGLDGFSPLVYSATAIMTNVNTGGVTAWSDNDTSFTITTLQASGTKGFTVAWRIISTNAGGQTAEKLVYSLFVTNTVNGNVTNIAAGTSGFTVATHQDGSGGQPEISIIDTIAAGALGGTYFTIDAVGTAYYVWFKEDGVGADPAVGGRVGFLVELSSTDDANRVAARIKDALSGQEITKIVCLAASTLSGGEYFNAYNTTTPFYVWYKVDGAGNDPAPGGKTGILINIIGSDTAAQVATKTAKAISSYFFVIPDIRGYFLRVWDNGAGNDPDSAERFGYGDYQKQGDELGTYQGSLLKAHTHIYPLVIFSNTLSKSGGDRGYIGDPPDQSPSTSSVGGDENRPVNFYVNYVIRY